MLLEDGEMRDLEMLLLAFGSNPCRAKRTLAIDIIYNINYNKMFLKFDNGENRLITKSMQTSVYCH